MENGIEEFKRHIKKHVVPFGGEILQQRESLINELEAYADGRAYDKLTGKPWKHRLEHTNELLKQLSHEL